MCVNIVCLLVCAVASGAAPQATGSTQVPGLLSADATVRQQAFQGILNARATLIADLLSVISKPGVDQAFGGPKYQAIVLLGRLRATEAANALASNLAYAPTPGVISESLPQEAYHVAAMALVSIGTPCVPGMVGLIKTSESKDERDVAAWVIMEIDGRDIALARLDIEINSPTVGREPKEHLKAAREFIASYKPNFTPPRPAPADRKTGSPAVAPR